MAETHETLDVAVIGVGRMGRHHARTYANLPDANLVAVVDFDEERAATVAEDFGCGYCTSIEELLSKHPNIKAVTVAVPTKHHAAAARPLLERGIACLVEKPLAATGQEARDLADFAARHDAILQVGHTERFNPAVQAVATLPGVPRFIEVDRVSPMTFRSLDVGVVMDLMIHDLDIVLTLARSELVRVDATGVAVVHKHEDVANARLVFANGCVANLTASRLALKVERKLRMFTENSYVSLDYQKRAGIIIELADNEGSLELVRDQLGSGKDLSDLDYSQLVNVEQLSMEDPEADPLTGELTSLLNSVRSNAPVAVDGYAGCAAVEAAERVLKAMAEHTWEGVNEARVTK